MNFSLLMEKYSCQIYALPRTLVYGKYQFDYKIEFLNGADAGEITRLLSIEGITPFFLGVEWDLHLSEFNLNKLIIEIECLWGDG
jgi:hypothetical protein